MAIWDGILGSSGLPYFPTQGRTLTAESWPDPNSEGGSKPRQLALTACGRPVVSRWALEPARPGVLIPALLLGCVTSGESGLSVLLFLFCKTEVVTIALTSLHTVWTVS